MARATAWTGWFSLMCMENRATAHHQCNGVGCPVDSLKLKDGNPFHGVTIDVQRKEVLTVSPEVSYDFFGFLGVQHRVVNFTLPHLKLALPLLCHLQIEWLWVRRYTVISIDKAEERTQHTALWSADAQSQGREKIQAWLSVGGLSKRLWPTCTYVGWGLTGQFVGKIVSNAMIHSWLLVYLIVVKCELSAPKPNCRINNDAVYMNSACVIHPVVFFAVWFILLCLCPW